MSWDFPKKVLSSSLWKKAGKLISVKLRLFGTLEYSRHSDLHDQNLFHSTIDTPPGVSRVYLDDQTEVYSGQLKGKDPAKIEETEKPSKLNKIF